MKYSAVDTPALLLDLDRVERNIGKLHNHLDSHGIRIRPHVKTHKIPAIAHMQLERGAVGVTAQKVSEAEVFVVSGIRDVLIAFNIVGRAKLDRLMMLARRARVSAVADSLTVIDGYAEAAEATRASISVFIECDTGLVRSGIREPDQALPLAERIARAPWLSLGGLMSFKGGPPDMDHVRHTDWFYTEATELLMANGIEVPLVSVGGTVYAWSAWPTVNPKTVGENRAGAYVFYDRVKAEQGVCSLDDCAATVLTTVVSTTTPGQAVLDAGTKSMPPDTYFGGADFGHVVEYPDAKVRRLFEEHAIVDTTACAQKPTVGERVKIVPNYVNGVVNSFDLAYGTRGDEVEAIWPVAGRGRTT